MFKLALFVFLIALSFHFSSSKPIRSEIFSPLGKTTDPSDYTASDFVYVYKDFVNALAVFLSAIGAASEYSIISSGNSKLNFSIPEVVNDVHESFTESIDDNDRKLKMKKLIENRRENIESLRELVSFSYNSVKMSSIGNDPSEPLEDIFSNASKGIAILMELSAADMSFIDEMKSSFQESNNAAKIAVRKVLEALKSINSNMIKPYSHEDWSKSFLQCRSVVKKVLKSLVGMDSELIPVKSSKDVKSDRFEVNLVLGKWSLSDVLIKKISLDSFDAQERNVYLFLNDHIKIMEYVPITGSDALFRAILVASNSKESALPLLKYAIPMALGNVELKAADYPDLFNELIQSAKSTAVWDDRLMLVALCTTLSRNIVLLSEDGQEMIVYKSVQVSKQSPYAFVQKTESGYISIIQKYGPLLE